MTNDKREKIIEKVIQLKNNLDVLGFSCKRMSEGVIKAVLDDVNESILELQRETAQ